MFFENWFVLMLAIWCQIFVDNYENAYKRELSRLTAKMDGRIIINFVHSYVLKHNCKIVKVIWRRHLTATWMVVLVVQLGIFCLMSLWPVPLNGFVNTGFNNFYHICKFKSYIHIWITCISSSHYFYIYLFFSFFFFWWKTILLKTTKEKHKV